MKKIIWLVFLFLASSHLAAQPCLPDGILFSSQKEIDEFAENYPHCYEILGDVWIYDYDVSDIKNLSGLNQVRAIGGNVEILDNEKLASLQGLNNLSSIGGYLHIAGNPKLVNLQGVNDLDSIRGYFSISNNDQLTSLSGLENLVTIYGHLWVTGNASLNSLSGLDNLSYIGGNLSIRGNEVLSACDAEVLCNYLSEPTGVVEILDNAPGCNTPGEIANSCGFKMPCLPYGDYYFSSQSAIDSFQVHYQDCTDLHGDVIISGNDINSLTGLDEVTSIEGELQIRGNEILMDLKGLEGLANIGGNLLFQDNAALYSTTGLDNLTAVGGDLKLGGWDEGNPVLAELTGLQRLETIGGSLVVYQNDSLQSLEGLEKLEQVEEIRIGGYWWNSVEIGLLGNTSLTSIEALSNITSCNQLYIVGNHSLRELTGLNNLTEVNGEVTIAGNDSLQSLAGLENLQTVDRLLIGFFKNLWTGVTCVGNPILSDLSGMENLTAINGYMRVAGNASLTSLSGLDNLELIAGDLWIIRNPSLKSCDIQGMCTYLNALDHKVYIYDNAPGCNSPGEIANACGFKMPCLPHGNYYFHHQYQLDSFQAHYQCTDLKGEVIIWGNDITNLSGLSQVVSTDNLKVFADSLKNFEGLNRLTRIRGDLLIPWVWQGNASLTGLDGLNSLVEIGGDFILSNTGTLNDLTGLGNLTSVGGDLQITAPGNDQPSALKTLSGLHNLTSVGGKLWISWNTSLANLEGLSKLSYIGDGIGIVGNPQLKNLTGLESLATLQNSIEILENDSLESLSALNNIMVWEGTINRLEINDNPSLHYCKIENLCKYLDNIELVSITNNALGCNSFEEVKLSCTEPCPLPEDLNITKQSMIENIPKFYPACNEIKGNLWIHGEDISSLSGLQNITAIGGDLVIQGNEVLKNLKGLESLQYIGGNLEIGDYSNIKVNPILSDLSGLENLETIGKRLLIWGNESLTDLSAMENLASIGSDLGIYSNEQLSICDAPGICHYLSDPNGQVMIANNAPGCNSQDEIWDSCVVSVDEVALASMIKVHPNPFTNSTTIEYELLRPQSVTITFYNHLGKQVDIIQKQQPAGIHQEVWAPAYLPAGIYYFRLQANKQVVSGKVVKM